MMNTPSERLNYLLKERDMGQSQLAKKLKVSNQLISMLCLGKRKSSKLWPEIAKQFGVDLNWLIHGTADGDPALMLAEAAVYNRFYKIPLVRDLGSNMLENEALKLENFYTNFEVTRDSEYRNLFALSTTNNSMKFKFGNDTTLIFHTNLEPVSGDFVVVYIPSKEIFIYRELRVEHNRYILVPMDEDLYKKLSLDEIGGYIVAVLYETRTKRILSKKTP